MKRKPLHFGIIGGGLMGREIASAFARWCHLLELPVRPVLRGVASGRESSLTWFKDNFDTLTTTTTDYRDLLASTEIEAVYVAVPHQLHESIYTDCLRAGKHLFGEKPFGIDAGANDTIASAAASNPTAIVRCVSQFPFYPGAQAVYKCAAAGQCGRILEVEVGFLHSSDLNPDKPGNWKRQNATNGLYGCMGDLGLHVLHIPLRLGWKPANVRSVLTKIYTERPDGRGGRMVCDTWDNATLLCDVPTDCGNFPLTVKTHRIAPGEKNTWYIKVIGTKRGMIFSTKEPRTLRSFEYRSGAEQAWATQDIGYDSLYRTVTGGIFEFGFSDAILQMLASFCDRVHQGPDHRLPFDCATLQETRDHHAILTAALVSQENAITAPVHYRSDV
ncbi:MAG: Gfo/Idh/MocA family oxidoreductase [Verrucomicrobiota bacterium]|nr:Gfo/Idh/MocA family oxidoreductase [Verrucomicrobiota bacterium]